LIWHGNKPFVNLILGCLNYTPFKEKDKRVGFRISLVTSDRAEFSAWHVTVKEGL
jgi:hypothetical protein